MKFSINTSELQNALSVVQKGVSNRSTLPVLSGILVDARQDHILLQATDLELSVQYSAPALVEEEGKTVVPGKLFTDIIKSLPDAAIHISGGETDIHINCDISSFSVKTLNYQDFPGFPQITPTRSIRIPFATFATMVRKVSRVVSRDESRAILTGVLISFEDGILRMVATDSYRLALTEAVLEGVQEGMDPSASTEATVEETTSSLEAPDATSVEGFKEDFEAVISGAFLNDIASISSMDAEVVLGLSDNQIIITCDNTIFINRRIEGTYPNYKQLLPDSYNTRATFNVAELTASVKRASILSSSTSTSAPMKFDISTPAQVAQITVNSPDVGSVQETLSCKAEGDELEITFNSSYVIDGLSAIKGEEVYFDIQSSLKPGVFRAVEPENYLYLIMPVRLKN